MNNKNDKGKIPEEWLKQSDYDMETARAMLESGRYIYCVFMCHLSIEKALKGLYHKKLKTLPPKTHNLVFLVEKIGLRLAKEMYENISNLSRISIPTRYPDDLEKMKKEYNKDAAETTLRESEEALVWIKQQYQK